MEEYSSDFENSWSSPQSKKQNKKEEFVSNRYIAGDVVENMSTRNSITFSSGTLSDAVPILEYPNGYKLEAIRDFAKELVHNSLLTSSTLTASELDSESGVTPLGPLPVALGSHSIDSVETIGYLPNSNQLDDVNSDVFTDRGIAPSGPPLSPRLDNSKTFSPQPPSSPQPPRSPRSQEDKSATPLSNNIRSNTAKISRKLSSRRSLNSFNNKSSPVIRKKVRISPVDHEEKTKINKRIASYAPLNLLGPVTSTVAKASKLPNIVVQKQLELALRKCDGYSKEVNRLQGKLDTSGIEEEFQRLREVIVNQSMQIKELSNENRALLIISKNQGKELLDKERKIESGYGEESLYNTEGQLKIVLERAKKLTAQLTDCRHRERMTALEKNKLAIECQDLKQQNLDLLRICEQLKGLNSGSVGVMKKDEPESMAERSTLGLESPSKDSFEVEILTLKNTIQRMKKSAQKQRVGFLSEIQQLKNQLIGAEKEKRRLSDELDKQERLTKNQMISIKRLRQAYEELLMSNQHLALAGDMYERDKHFNHSPEKNASAIPVSSTTISTSLSTINTTSFAPQPPSGSKSATNNGRKASFRSQISPTMSSTSTQKQGILCEITEEEEDNGTRVSNDKKIDFEERNVVIDEENRSPSPIEEVEIEVGGNLTFLTSDIEF